VPRGKEDLFLESQDIVNRLSISHVNEHRLRRLWGQNLEKLRGRPRGGWSGLNIYQVRVNPKFSRKTDGKKFYESGTPRRDTEYWDRFVGRAVGCFCGVIPTPTACWNNVRFVRTDRYFEGQAQVEILADRLNQRLPATPEEIERLANEDSGLPTRYGDQAGPIESVLSRGVVSFVQFNHWDTGFPQQLDSWRKYQMGGRNVNMIRMRNHVSSQCYLVAPEEGPLGMIHPIEDKEMEKDVGNFAGFFNS
jgi:hypothetical protein